MPNIASSSDCIDALSDEEEYHQLAQQLFDASIDEDVGQINLLLKKYPGLINVQDESGRSPLIIASMLGHHNVVLALLAHDITTYDGDYDYSLEDLYTDTTSDNFSIHFPQGVDMSILDNYGRNALMWASVKGHDNIARLLMKEPGVVINAKDEDGKTALALASEEGYALVVKALLAPTSEIYDLFKMLGFRVLNKIESAIKKNIQRKIVDINSQDNLGHTPLMLAIRNNRTEVVQTLIDNDAGKRFDKLIFSSGELYFHELENLYSTPFLNVNLEDKKGYTALHWAGVLADYRTLELLFSQYDVDTSYVDLSKIQHQDIEIFLDKHERFSGFYKDIATAWSQKIVNPHTTMVWADKFLTNRYRIDTQW